MTIAGLVADGISRRYGDLRHVATGCNALVRLSRPCASAMRPYVNLLRTYEFDIRPHRRCTWTVQSYSPAGDNMHCHLIHAIAPSQNCFIAWGMWTQTNTWFLGFTRVHIPNGISIGSAVFGGLTTATDRQTDRRTDHATPCVT